MTFNHVYDIGALRAYLTAQSQLNTMVGGRIYGHEIPDFESKDMPRKVILINSVGRGNQNTGYLPLDNTLKDIRCYAESPYESARLYDLVKVIMREMTRTEVLPAAGLAPVVLYNAFVVAGGFTNREPDTNWPVTFGTFNVLVSEV